MPYAVQRHRTTLLALLPKLLIGISFAMLTACGGGSSGPGAGNPNPPNPPAPPPPPPGNPTASETIGDMGGEITSPDGQMVLSIPVGALDGDTVITIEEIPPAEFPAELDGLGVSRAYDLQPDGLSFNEPVEVLFTFDVADSGEDFIEGPVDLSLFNLSASGLEILEDASITVIQNAAQAELRGRISHFSLTGYIGSGFDDLVKVSGVPDVVEVGKPFDVTVRIFHRETSDLAADAAVFTYPLGFTAFDVTDESKRIFKDSPPTGFPTQPYFNFGPVVPQVEKAVSQVFSFVCKKSGVYLFRGNYQYLKSGESGFVPGGDILGTLTKAVACIDRAQLSVTQLVDNTDPEAPLRAEWGFGALPNTTDAIVGSDFTIKLFQNGPLNTTPESVEIARIGIIDINPGVVTAVKLADPATGLGGNDISLFGPSNPEEGAIRSAFLADVLVIRDFQNFLANEQFLTYRCLTPGFTQIVFDLAISGQTPGGSEVIARSGLHVNVNCKATEEDPDRADKDNDGVGLLDLCPSEPGGTEFGCASEITNGQTRMGCQAGGSCALDGPTGSCSQCGVRRLSDDTTLISNSDTGTITISLDDVYDTSGAVAYTTELVSGIFGDDVEAVLDDQGITCRSGEAGEGCDGTFANGEPMGCPPGETCEVQVILGEALSDPTPEIATVDVRKATIGGEGAFEFEWSFSRGTPAEELASSSFEIATSEGAGASMSRLFFPEENSGLLRVSESPGGGFTLGGITCSNPLAGIDVSNAAFDTGTDTDCTFTNEITVSTITRDLPGFLTGPREINVVPPGAFGLPADLPLVSIGTDQGPAILNIDTADFVDVGQDTTNFSAAGTPPTDGALVLLNGIINTADVVSGFGQSPTISFQFSPTADQFSPGILSFDSVNDMSFVGDSASTAALRISDSNIDALITDVDNPAGGFRTRTVGPFERFTSLENPVVSGYSHSLGLLECYNPCGGSGSEMPAVCAEFDPFIDLVITDQPSCAAAWTPTSCADAYNIESGGICDLPREIRKVNFGGMILGVTRGPNSEIFLVDPAWSPTIEAEVIGISGNDARDVDCVGEYCVVANYGSSTVTVVFWDALKEAEVIANLSVGAGPLKVDIIATPSELDIQSYQVAVSTSLDNSYQVIVLGSDGSVLLNEAKAVPAACAEPYGVAWMTNFEVTINCRGSDNYVVDRPFD